MIRRSPGPGRTAPGHKRLSVVIPAFREAERIAETVTQVRAELAPALDPGDLEVVVVDDGSGDGTAEAAASADLVVALAHNRGKGAAVRSGMLAASGRSRVFTDADLSYAPSQIVRVLEELEAGWDLVVGNRYHHQTNTTVPTSTVRNIGGRLINAATRVVLRHRFDDTQCGLKGFRSDVAEVLFSQSMVDGFAFDVELLMLADRYDLSVLEVPVELENSGRSTVRVARDASRLLLDLARIRVDMGRGRYEADPVALERLDR